MERVFEFKHPGKTFVEINDSTIVISRKGTLNAVNLGLQGGKTIPFSSITAVQFKKCGLTNGYLQLLIAGAVEKRGGVFSATQDENAIIFSKKYEPLALELKEIIEQKMAQSSQPQTIIQNNVSVADELMKLKSLLDSGVLTQSEFDEQKAKLMK